MPSVGIWLFYCTCDLIAIHEKTDKHAHMHKMWVVARVLFTPPTSLRPNGRREGRCTRFPSKHVRRPIKSNCCYSQRRRVPTKHNGTIDVACQLNLRLVSETSRPDKAPRGDMYCIYTSRNYSTHTTQVVHELSMRRSMPLDAS